MKMNELSRTTKSNSKKHKMLIPCYNGEKFYGIELNTMEFIQNTFSLSGKSKKKLDGYGLEELCPRDQQSKYMKIRMTFAYQAHAIITNTLSYLCNKYRQSIKHLFNNIDEDIYRYEIDPFYCIMNVKTIPTLPPFYNFKGEFEGERIIYDIQDYLTNDETIIEDNTVMLMSIIADSLYDNISQINPSYTSEELLEYMDQFLREAYDSFYIIFSKLMVLARQYESYATYGAVLNSIEQKENEDENKKVIELEQPSEE